MRSSLRRGYAAFVTLSTGRAVPSQAPPSPRRSGLLPRSGQYPIPSSVSCSCSPWCGGALLFGLLVVARSAHADTTFTVNSIVDQNDLDFPGSTFDNSSDGAATWTLARPGTSAPCVRPSRCERNVRGRHHQLRDPR